ncbi:MAG: DNA repair protein RecN [Christensenellales bacterium]
MLKNLIINNFALIKNLEVEFGENLNVISGETGSGKSLIMKALKFVLGDRADKSYIRNGERLAKVQCVFDGVKESVVQKCVEFGIEINENEPLIIVRTLNTEGRGDIRINGTLCTLSTLNQITSLIVDFYGQQEHFSLLESGKQFEVVDNFKSENIKNLKIELHDLICEKKEIESKLNQNYGNENEKKFKIELLEYEINELESNQFEDGYEDELRDKKLKFQSIEKIKNHYDTIKQILNFGYNNSTLSNAFKEISSNIKAVEKYDDSVSEVLELSDNIRFEVEELEGKITDLDYYLNGADLDIDKIEDELDKIKNIKRKYGQTKNERDLYYKKSKEELNFIVNNDETIKKYKNQLNAINEKIYSVCNALFDERENVIKEIESGIISNLRDLEMKNANFKIEHKLNEDLSFLTNNGLDVIEFLFTSNLGQPLKPLSKVISGGELSRFMLAYKNVIMMKDEIELLIFDEIDSGISGIVGQKVANKICDISRQSQVISISHLPQIVSMADENFKVYKENCDNETLTKIETLNDETVLKEIARLSGSKEFKDLDLKYASELRLYSQNYKVTAKN